MMHYNPDPNPQLGAIGSCLYLIFVVVVLVHAVHTIYDDVRVYLNHRRYVKDQQIVCTCEKVKKSVLIRDFNDHGSDWSPIRVQIYGDREQLCGSICQYCKSRRLNDPHHRDDFLDYHEDDRISITHLNYHEE
jgi:hypothetical protein